MAICFNYKLQYGEMTITQRSKEGAKTFKIDIVGGNCLAVFNSPYIDKETGKEMVSLYNFWVDESHVNNILKSGKSLFWDEVSKVKLNTYFKESFKLIRIFTKAGIKVTAYYKEPKEKNKK